MRWSCRVVPCWPAMAWQRLWTGKRCACERVSGSPMLYCRVHHLCECIHEIERSLNFNLYNTDYLFVPRASRASTRGCSPARFLHCAIAPPRGFSATVTDKVVKKISVHFRTALQYARFHSFTTGIAAQIFCISVAYCVNLSKNVRNQRSDIESC